MAYADPVQRIAMYRGFRLGTELQSIIPGSQRLGGEVTADIDKATAYVSIMSPGMSFRWTVMTYLLAKAEAGKTKQISLHHSFLQEMLYLQAAGLKFNDLAWIDDVSRHTTVNGTSSGAGTNVVIQLVSVAALGTITDGQTLVWIGSESAKVGFVAVVKAHSTMANTITVDIPDEVLVGGVVEEEERGVADDYDVYVADIHYPRCRYGGQNLPEPQEASQDFERFNMTYEFVGDTLPRFAGAA